MNRLTVDNEDKKDDEKPQPPKLPEWLTVYTEYGYGQVNAQKFYEQTQECEAEHKKAAQPVLEYFKTKFAELRAA